MAPTIPKMMKAAIVEEHGKPLVVKEIPVPKPGRGEVLVKIYTSGCCHTDIHVAGMPIFTFPALQGVPRVPNLILYACGWPYIITGLSLTPFVSLCPCVSARRRRLVRQEQAPRDPRPRGRGRRGPGRGGGDQPQGMQTKSCVYSQVKAMHIFCGC